MYHIHKHSLTVRARLLLHTVPCTTCEFRLSY